MSKLELGNISIIEPQIVNNLFIIGDVVNGGGYIDPSLITDQVDLERRFRYSENYESYKAIIDSGGALALAGNRKNFWDIPTIVVFNQNSEIGLSPENLVPDAHPLYEDLFKNFDEFLNELTKQSAFLSSGTPIDRLNLFKGYSQDKYQTYRIKVKPSSEGIYENLVEGNKKGDINILVLPIYDQDSSINLNISFLLQTQEDSEWIPSQELINDTIGIDISGAAGDIWLVKFDYYNDHCRIKLSNRTSESTITNIDLPEYSEWTDEAVLLGIERAIEESGNYSNGEIFSVNDELELTFESPYLVQYFDFCTKYCKVLSIECDTVFTQRIYYLRGLEKQGIIISGYSNFANKEGRGIELNYSCSNSEMYLLLKFLDEEYEYRGNSLLEEVSENPLITFTDINYVTQDIQENSYESIVDYGVFNTDSYDPGDWDLDSLINAYESFFEYEVYPSVLFAPQNIGFWRRTPLVSELRKFTKDHLVGGMNSTLCVQINEGEEGYIPGLAESIGENVFLFSGKFTYPAMYRYIEKWVRDREFNSDPGYDINPGYPNTLNFEYKNYSIAYDTSNDFILSMAISHLLNTIYRVIYPGISINSARTELYNGIAYVKSYNPILSDVKVNYIKQVQNTLTIDIDIYYISIPDEIKINFKIYKTYD